MNLKLVISLIAAVAEISAIVQDAVMDYFESDILVSGNKTWQSHQIAYEHTLYLAMQESYGFKGMNVYVKRPPYPFRVSRGYYHTDNQVHLFLDDLKLEDYPHLEDPKISFPLLSNVILVDGMVSKMHIHANYIVFRNTSFIVYDRAEQDPFRTSPFLFEQVRNTGQLAITVEGCKLGGMGIIVMTGNTVSLGNTIFKLRNCQFVLEIFTPGIDSPPVVANYLLKSQGGVGLTLEDVLIKPLAAELLPKLQAALHAYVNTSAIFDHANEYGLLRLAQRAVFEKSTNYMNNVIRNLNILSINRNNGKIRMDDLIIPYNDTMEEGAANSMFSLTNLFMTGTETLYSAHTGGPYKTDITKMYEEFRFGTIQVTGSMTLQVMDKTEGMYDFAAEINDVEIDVTFHINRRPAGHDDLTETPICITARRHEPQTEKPSIKLAPDEYSIAVTGWRALAFSSPSNKFVLSEAVVTGYLLHLVPFYLKRHLESILAEAVIETDKEYLLLVKIKNEEADSKKELKTGTGHENAEPIINDGDAQPIDKESAVNDESNVHEVITESEVDFDHPVTHTEPSNIGEPIPDAYLNADPEELDGDDDEPLKPKFFDENKFSKIVNEESEDPMYDDAMVRRQLRKGSKRLRQKKNVKRMSHRKWKPFKLQNPITNEIRRSK